MSEYRSAFGGLWPDRVDAEDVLRSKQERGEVSDADAERLQSWIDNGFVVFEGAISPEEVAAFDRAILQALDEEDPRFRATVMGYKSDQRVPLERRFADWPSLKILDSYYFLPQARDILLAAVLTDFLKLIFEAPPMLFQSLSFVKGSEQSLHQDTAYVKVEPPCHLAAAWVALEDIEEGSGELVYAPGSHRIPEELFGGTDKAWMPEHGQAEHDRWMSRLEERVKEAGLTKQRFRPRQGDAFLWHADLAHGGAPIEKETVTRRSVVGHYCAIGDRPYWFGYAGAAPETLVHPWRDGFFASDPYNRASPPANSANRGTKLLRRLVGSLGR
jgi:phytanoyl-CoA hydroxylase